VELPEGPVAQAVEAEEKVRDETVLFETTPEAVELPEVPVAQTAEESSDVITAEDETDRIQPQSDQPDVPWVSLTAQFQIQAGVTQLVAMGFEEDASKIALADARGNTELAVEYLITGRRPSSLESVARNALLCSQNILASMRARLHLFRDRLREQAKHHCEKRGEHQNQAQDAAQKRLQTLQATLLELKSNLQAFGPEFKGRFSEINCRVRQQYGTIERKIVDAYLFLTESLALLRGQAADARSTASTTHEGENPEVLGEESVQAMVVASEDAALQALSAADAFLLEQQTATSETSSVASAVVE